MKSSISTKKRFKDGKLLTGFTLIELIVVIVIIVILSGIIMFAVTQYISKGKDSSVAGYLSILISAGEVFYNAGNSYEGFCNPDQNNAIKNVISQVPENYGSVIECYNSNPSPSAWTGTSNIAGICCIEDAGHNYQSWAACAQKFTNALKAHCVDSRGVRKEIDRSLCNTEGLTDPTSGGIQCPN